jgi:hypothetical protein
MIMAETKLNTILRLKYDTLANWQEATKTAEYQPRKGEVCIVEVPAAAGQVIAEPAILFKVGDGTGVMFKKEGSESVELPWVSGLAADVHAWAKEATKPSYTATEISGIDSYIKSYVETDLGLSTDTDTQYRIEKGADNYTYVLQSKEKSAATWTNVSTVNIPNDEAAIAQVLVDAKAYADGLNTAMNTRVAALEAKLGEGEGSVADLIANAVKVEKERAEAKELELSNAIAGEISRAEGKEAELATAINTEKTRAEAKEAELNTAIGTEKTRAEAKEAEIAAAAQAAQGKADSAYALADSKTTMAAVEAKGYAVAAEVNGKLDEKVDKKEGYSLISDAEIARLASVENFDDAEVKGLIEDNADAIAAILDGSTAKTIAEVEASIAGVKATADAAATQTDLAEEIARAKKAEEDLAAADASINTDIEALEGSVSTIDGKVTTLIGSDAGKSVRTIANEELAAQLIAEGANEKLDTLKEIADWIQAHPGDAAAMNSAISALQAKTVLGTYEVEGEDGEKVSQEYATVKAYVEAAIAALNIGDYALAADLTALADRVTAVETKASNNEAAITNITKEDGLIATAKAEAIADAKAKADNALAAAKAYTDTEIDTVEGTIANEVAALEDKIALKANDADLAAIAKTGNVADLVQTPGDVLVLFGGNAFGYTE